MAKGGGGGGPLRAGVEGGGDARRGGGVFNDVGDRGGLPDGRRGVIVEGEEDEDDATSDAKGAPGDARAAKGAGGREASKEDAAAAWAARMMGELIF